MANKNRLFISFPIEDKVYCVFLSAQAKNKKSPFEFTDMSVKDAWDEKWKSNCRARIKGCDGMIALVSKNTAKATGQHWEVACAKAEKVPVRGMYISADDKPSPLPMEFDGVRVVEWGWDNIANFVNSL
jgi:hypothetical protein